MTYPQWSGPWWAGSHSEDESHGAFLISLPWHQSRTRWVRWKWAPDRPATSPTRAAALKTWCTTVITRGRSGGSPGHSCHQRETAEEAESVWPVKEMPHLFRPSPGMHAGPLMGEWSPKTARDYYPSSPLLFVLVQSTATALGMLSPEVASQILAWHMCHSSTRLQTSWQVTRLF